MSSPQFFVLQFVVPQIASAGDFSVTVADYTVKATPVTKIMMRVLELSNAVNGILDTMGMIKFSMKMTRIRIMIFSQ
jgi:hypothetical protein